MAIAMAMALATNIQHQAPSGNTTLQRWEPQSIRLHLIRVAGKLLTGANQLRLKLVSPPLAAKVWQDWLALSNPA